MKRPRLLGEANAFTSPITTSSPSPHSHPRHIVSAFSCERCAKRKVKCDKAQPRCSACVRHGADCVASQPTIDYKPRKKRFPEAELLQRIDIYESTLKRLGLDPDRVREGKADLAHSLTSSFTMNPTGLLRNGTRAQGDSKAAKDDKHLVPMEGVRDIMSIMDELWQEDGSLAILFAPGRAEDTICPSHPSSLEIVKLWQLYLDTVQPINKVLHAPTMSKKVFDLAARVEAGKFSIASSSRPEQNAPHSALLASDHALLFAMYSAVVAIHHPEDFSSALGSDRSRNDWLLYTRRGARYWLHQSNVFRTSDPQVVQALVLFLNVLGAAMDPRTLSSFAGLTDRLARRIGLHRDPSSDSTLSQVDVEMRRRIWWELLLLESRGLEKAGVGACGLDNNWRVSLPSGIGDSDLNSRSRSTAHPDSDISSLQSEPSSEMTFFLVRCEIAAFLHDLRLSQGRDVGWTEFSTPQYSLREKLAQIDDLERLLHRKYLLRCNPAHALQKLTLAVVKGNLNKMRVSAYISEESQQARGARRCRAIDETSCSKSQTSCAQAGSNGLAPGTVALRTDMIILCTEAVLTMDQLLKDPFLRRYNGFLQGNKPIVALIQLSRLLKEYTVGEEVDRAWNVIEAADWIFPAVATGAIDKAPGKLAWMVVPLLLSAWEARKVAKKGQIEEEPAWWKRINQFTAQVESGLPTRQVVNSNGNVVGESMLHSAEGRPMDISTTAEGYDRVGPGASEVAVAQTLASQMVERNNANGERPLEDPLPSECGDRFLLPLDQSFGDQNHMEVASRNLQRGISVTSPSLEIDFDWEQWFQTSLLGDSTLIGTGGAVMER